MEGVNRRCRRDTVLAKPARLLRRVGRLPRLGSVLKKPFSADVEKALASLDGRLLRATPNALEWGHRRYRRMQWSVHRVWNEAGIPGQLALDRERGRHLRDQAESTRALHHARAA